MKRRERSPDEFMRELGHDPQLLELFGALKHDERLTVRPDGTGGCLFKVYLRDRLGPKEGFLRAWTPLDKSYVDWSRQPPECRDAFSPIVVNPNKPDGSRLRSGASVDEVVQAARHFADAVERLNTPLKETIDLFPDEVPPDLLLTEGAVRAVTVNAYERNTEARRRCISAHQARCFICYFDFESMYGPEFAGFIHVHHLRPLSEIHGEYVVDPVEDLRPVCPNCHAVIHHGGRLRDVEEVRQLLARQRRAQRDDPRDKDRT